MASNSAAFFGGLLGTTLLSGGVAALVMFAPTFEVAADDASTVDFIPGDLVRLGPQRDPQALPDKLVIPATRAPDDAAPSQVTTNDQPAPPTPLKKPGDPPKAAPARPLDPRAPVDDRNRPANTPHDDPRTADELPGDPFGAADGWSDTFNAGDPWATEVMRALNNMRVGTFGAEAQDVVYKFRLEVCPDGGLSAQLKQSTGDPVLDARIKNTIDALEVDVPDDVLALLGGKCQKIKYEFTWRGKNIGRGTVQ
ncbi:hypothetical protein [Nannocystis punicea]|uniref:Uncharacterized protein n=1 Tax=Nannocystis punicea TaxID=2995304 RepID=A0ABY7H1Y6_9BACT|nr:hypothetical protein [Nannocystis poenicansa]WAS93140.1 hypothetical protein O0S08_43815 [Nannocystis poenicansa]